MEQPEFDLNDIHLKKTEEINPLTWMVIINHRTSPPLTAEEVYKLDKGLVSDLEMLREKTGLPRTEAENIKMANRELSEIQSKIPPHNEV